MNSLILRFNLDSFSISEHAVVIYLCTNCYIWVLWPSSCGLIDVFPCVFTCRAVGPIMSALREEMCVDLSKFLILFIRNKSRVERIPCEIFICRCRYDYWVIIYWFMLHLNQTIQRAPLPPRDRAEGFRDERDLYRATTCSHILVCHDPRAALFSRLVLQSIDDPHIILTICS